VGRNINEHPFVILIIFSDYWENLNYNTINGMINTRNGKTILMNIFKGFVLFY